MIELSALPERFRSKVATSDSGCWEWTASCSRGGYGQYHVEGTRKMAAAHRFAYESLVGPIADGLHIDHLCRNRRCVNPLHLDPVTQRVNNERGIKAMRTHCKSGHALSGENLRRNPTTGTRMCETCLRARAAARLAGAHATARPCESVGCDGTVWAKGKCRRCYKRARYHARNSA